jgi:hypothetical protein
VVLADAAGLPLEGAEFSGEGDDVVKSAGRLDGAVLGLADALAATEPAASSVFFWQATDRPDARRASATATRARSVRRVLRMLEGVAAT